MDEGEEATKAKTRIYVGGLGAGVTEDDLRKTFSALGEVVSVDVVRTKGRSFAYLDFLPASDKSLPKLFSTYNGCMWKGGRLRLEKAKEHYLARLKREWQEESENASKASESFNTVATKTDDTLEKPKKPSPTDKTQIQLYFPKLRKVKSLAQVGIGKHKYSFQRIQVPPLPTHFCDCEEHSLDFPPPVKNRTVEIQNESYGINEHELNIMNSVLNRILERANPSKQVTERSALVKGNDEPVAAQTDEEDHLSDEDDLVINVANRKNDSMDVLGEMSAMMVNQAAVAKKPNTAEKPNSVNDNLKKKTVPLTKKRKQSRSEEKSGNFLTRSDSQEKGKKKVELVTNNSGNNSLRSLKSTWKDLIGQKRNTSFSISDFIASIPERKGEELTVDNANQPQEKNDKRRKLDGDQNGPGPVTEVGEVPTKDSISDIANDGQQKEEERKADKVDLLDHEEEEPKADDLDIMDNEEEDNKSDDLDCNWEKHENDQDLEKPTKDSQVKNDEDLIRTARGEFWRHKSSWTQLISTASHTSFSISHILPNTSSEKHEQVNTFDSQPSNKNPDNQISIVQNKVTSSPVKKKNISEKKRILSLGNLESDDTCLFMRTEDSMKEWKKAKASVSGSLNKRKKLVNESA